MQKMESCPDPGLRTWYLVDYSLPSTSPPRHSQKSVIGEEAKCVMKSFANMWYIKVLIKNNQKKIYIDMAVTVFSNYLSNLGESPFLRRLVVHRLYEIHSIGQK